MCLGGLDVWCTGWGCGEEEEEEVLHLDVEGGGLLSVAVGGEGTSVGTVSWGMCCGVVEGSGGCEWWASGLRLCGVGGVGWWAVGEVGRLPCGAQGGVVVRRKRRRCCIWMLGVVGDVRWKRVVCLGYVLWGGGGLGGVVSGGRWG